MKQRTQAEQVMALAKAHGVLRPRDLDAHGLGRAVLSRLCRAGKLLRRGRGLYVAGVTGMTENHSFAEIARPYLQMAVGPSVSSQTADAAALTRSSKPPSTCRIESKEGGVAMNISAMPR